MSLRCLLLEELAFCNYDVNKDMTLNYSIYFVYLCLIYSVEVLHIHFVLFYLNRGVLKQSNLYYYTDIYSHKIKRNIKKNISKIELDYK